MSYSNSPINLIFPKLQWQDTETSLADWPGPVLEPENPWFCIGSCFAERSAKALKQHLLPVHFAATAALYTPEAIWRWLQLCQLAGEHSYETFCREQKALIYYDAKNLRYLHPYSPGGFSADGPDKLCAQLWQLCRYEYQFLRQSQVVLITLGSSFSFYSEQQGCYWSNGHKLVSSGDSAVLQRRLLSSQHIHTALRELCHSVQSISPQAIVVVSVSPVRHAPLAAVDNSLSKAQLLCAANQLCRDSELYYFPAYEIVMDELRDYRWYDAQRKQLRLDSFALLLERLLQQAASPRLRQYLQQVCQLARLLRHKTQSPSPWLREIANANWVDTAKNSTLADSCSSSKHAERQAEKFLLQLQQDYPQQKLPADIAQYSELLRQYRLETHYY